MFHVYKTKGRNCYGMTLWRWNSLQVEFWICPPNFSIGEHTHPDMDGEIILLTGDVNLCKRVNGEVKSTDRKFKMLSVPRATPHFFTPRSHSRIPTVFINIERWHVPPTSACVNIVKV
jgi:hypothetical protein